MLDSFSGDSERPAPPEDTTRTISRREFGRNLAVAGASLGSAGLLLGATASAEAVPAQGHKPDPALEGLAPDEAAEVESRLASIVQKYGSRLSPDQTKHLRRILAQNERLLAPVRAFPLQNGDPPSSILRISFDQPETAAQAEKS
ncbi:MAG TPA: hypothetical protein VEJ67_09745 [Candidatus Cybelea sp.]|nr:hypothetical protein [Candidatus Cybelea sp.]